MKLSKFIEYLQRNLSEHGDAEIYSLGEFGEKEHIGYLEYCNKVVKEGYYDWEADIFYEDETEVDYYYLVN